MGRPVLVLVVIAFAPMVHAGDGDVPDDVLRLVNALPRYMQASGDSHGSEIDALTLRLARDPDVAKGLVAHASPLVRAAALRILIRRGRIGADDLAGRLDGEAPYVRARVLEALALEPEPWGEVLLARLADREFDVAAALRQAIEAGAVDRSRAAAALQEHHRSIHPFVRIRAAEAMLAVARPLAARWLEEELRLEGRWKAGTVSCHGERGGVAGRVDRLLDRFPGPDPYDTFGEPTPLPPETFEVVVLRKPYAEKVGLRIFLLNATGKELVLYPNRRLSFSVTRGPLAAGGMSGGGMTSHSGHARTPDRHGPEGVVLAWDLPLDEKSIATATKVVVTCWFTLPERRAASYAFEILPADLPRGTDLENLEALLRLSVRTDARIHDARLSKSAERVPDEDRPALIALLLDHLERLDRRRVEAGGDAFPERDGAGITQDTYYDLLVGLGALSPKPTPGMVVRLLRLRASSLAGVLKHTVRWSDPVLRAAVLSEKPAAIRLAARLGCGGGMRPAEMRPHVLRWLASEDPGVLEAALWAAARVRVDAEASRRALERGLASSEERLRTLAIRLTPDLVADTAGLLLPILDRTEDPVERTALIRTMTLAARKGDRSGEDDLRALGERTLAAWAEDPEHGAIADLLSERPDVAGNANFLEAYRRTRSPRLLGILSRRSYVPESPVLVALRETKGPLSMETTPWHRLWRLETERLVVPEPESPETHYAALLRSSLRTGDHASARDACLLLSAAGDARGDDLLETACGSDDPVLHLTAIWCLFARDPARARPWLRAAMEDPTLDRTSQWRHRKAVERHAPKILEELRSR